MIKPGHSPTCWIQVLPETSAWQTERPVAGRAAVATVAAVATCEA